MFVALPGIIGQAGGGPPPPPPAGTLLSSHCSGYSAQDAGAEDYTDAVGTIWNGMFTTWEQLADGTGGSYWSILGNNSSDAYSACWYPDGFCMVANNTQNYTYWDGCGSTGDFGPTSYSYYYLYADGTGGTYSDGGGGNYDPPAAGAIIYQSGESGCCTVYYDGNNGYYISDTCGPSCPPYGTWLSDGCNATSGYDASGSYFDGAWSYGSFYADGECGSYFVESGADINGCYYPAGWKFDYSDSSESLHWTVSDATATTVAEGDTTYATSWSSSAIADGSGGTYSDSAAWSLNSGDEIAYGTYYDGYYGMDYYYIVYYDGMGGYYTSQYPL